MELKRKNHIPLILLKLSRSGYIVLKFKFKRITPFNDILRI